MAAAVKIPDKGPPRLRLGLGHPGIVMETAALSSMDLGHLYYRVEIPFETIRNGQLSAVQLETIRYASQTIDFLKPDGTGAGFLMGDGPGVGKGRTLAGIVYENYLRGRQQALWLSAYDDIKYEIMHDLAAIGASRIHVRVLKDLEYGTISSQVLTSTGIVLCSYSELISESKTKEKGKYRTRFRQLLQWCGKNFQGVIIFDEAHKAKDLCADDSGKTSKLLQTVLELQRKLPKARVVYASATGASMPKNMAHMVRLGLWGQGSAFGCFNDFITAVERRGVGAMEIVAMDMKLRGMYIARQLSFKGVSFRIEVVRLSRDFRKIYNLSVKLWVEARKMFAKAADLIELDTSVKLVMWEIFWSSHQRFFKYLFFAAKVNRAILTAREAIKNGKCVVIGLQATGEKRDDEELEDFVFTAKGVFQDLVERHFPAPDRQGVNRIRGLYEKKASQLEGSLAGEVSQQKEKSSGGFKDKKLKRRNGSGEMAEASRKPKRRRNNEGEEVANMDDKADFMRDAKKKEDRKNLDKDKETQDREKVDKENEDKKHEDKMDKKNKHKKENKENEDKTNEDKKNKDKKNENRDKKNTYPKNADKKTEDKQNALSKNEDKENVYMGNENKKNAHKKSEDKENANKKNENKKNEHKKTEAKKTKKHNAHQNNNDDLEASSTGASDASSDFHTFCTSTASDVMTAAFHDIELACSLKEELLSKIDILGKRLPPNSLDHLIDELGGSENVAELTSRRGRIVQHNDGTIKYEPRLGWHAPLGTLILDEKRLFMLGGKDVAIISEPASSALNLQSDRSNKKPRRRVHITLELPWSTDMAIQQLGRTHRCNQALTPEYIFLTTDLAGEQHFASALAKRLETMGAHCVRRTKETRDLSQLHVENKYGLKALEKMMRTIMGYETTPLVPPPTDYSGEFFKDIAGALVGVGIIVNSESHPGVLSLDKDYNNISTFLNRILGCPVDLQNRLFKYFTDTMTAIIEQAKHGGRFDLGIVDLGAPGRVVNRLRHLRFWRQHATGTAPSELHTVRVEHGMMWRDARAKYAYVYHDYEGFYLSHKSRNQKRTVILALVLPSDDSSSSDSSSSDISSSSSDDSDGPKEKRSSQNKKEIMCKVYRPHTGLQTRHESLYELEKRYKKVRMVEAQPHWTEHYNASVNTCSHAYWTGNCRHASQGKDCEQGLRYRLYHILTGYVLCVWNRVEHILNAASNSKIQLVRVKTTDDMNIVGTLIPSDCYEALINDLRSDCEEQEEFNYGAEAANSNPAN